MSLLGGSGNYFDSQRDAYNAGRREAIFEIKSKLKDKLDREKVRNPAQHGVLIAEIERILESIKP